LVVGTTKSTWSDFFYINYRKTLKRFPPIGDWNDIEKSS